MAILSNINGLFAVEDNGAIKFNNLTGTNNQVLIANTGASPTWVNVDTIIGGPYLPLTGGNLAGAGNLVVGGTLTVNGATTLNAALTGTTATFSGLVSGITPSAAANFATKAYVDAHPGDNTTWPNVVAGIRTNYTLGFKPPTNGYAGFYFETSAAAGAGYLLIRGESGSGAYTSQGISLIADAGWLSLVSRTTSDKGVRIMAGATATTRLKIVSAGDITFNEAYTFPTTDGSVNQVLKTDGSGNLDWATDANDNTTWPNVGAGTRTNYTLGFKPPASNYAGFYFETAAGANAGYLLIRGSSDAGQIYKAEGITLVSDSSWVTIASRTTTDAGVRLMSGATSVDRLVCLDNGDSYFTGELGIATSSPNYPLDIQSTATGLTSNLKLNKNSITGDYAEIAFQLWSGAGSGLNTFGGTGNSRPSVVLRAINENGNQAAGAFVVGTFTGGSNNSTLTEKFRISSAGNVGIGTESPTDAKLEVEGNVNSGLFSVFAKNSNAGSAAYVSKKWLNDDAAFGEIWRNSSTRSSGGQGASSFNMYNSADINFWSGTTHTMALVGNKVGIGATSPGATLQVGGGTANVLHKIWGSGTAGIQIFTNSPSTETKIISLEQYFSNEGYLGLYYNGTEKVRFRSNDNSYINGGNLGLGVTGPTEKLVVAGKVMINNAVAPNNLAQLNIGYTASNETRAIDIDGGWGAGESKSISFTYGGAATNLVGQINCKHDSPGSRISWGKLYHSGDSSTYTMELISSSQTTANLTVAGNITAAADVVAYSDERLKSNIKTLDGSKVLKMRGVSFEKEGKKGSGVIAQELEKIAPELVNNDNEYKGVAYGNLTGYLIEAIKELEARVKELENK